MRERTNKAVFVIALILSALVFTYISSYAQKPPSNAGEKFESKLITIDIPFQTVYKPDRTISPGRMKKHQQGKPGKAMKMVQEVIRNGKVKRTVVLWEKVVEEPVNEVILISPNNVPTSRGSFVRTKTLTMEATAYSSQEPGLSNRTATGQLARFGVVAVDPKVIPLGTKLYVEGYGYAIAADTGSAIKGMKIDLCFNTLEEVRRFGRKKVRVHILD